MFQVSLLNRTSQKFKIIPIFGFGKNNFAFSFSISYLYIYIIQMHLHFIKNTTESSRVSTSLVNYNDSVSSPFLEGHPPSGWREFMMS